MARQRLPGPGQQPGCALCSVRHGVCLRLASSKGSETVYAEQRSLICHFSGWGGSCSLSMQALHAAANCAVWQPPAWRPARTIADQSGGLELWDLLAPALDSLAAACCCAQTESYSSDWTREGLLQPTAQQGPLSAQLQHGCGARPGSSGQRCC